MARRYTRRSRSRPSSVDSVVSTDRWFKISPHMAATHMSPRRLRRTAFRISLRGDDSDMGRRGHGRSAWPNPSPRRGGTLDEFHVDGRKLDFGRGPRLPIAADRKLDSIQVAALDPERPKVLADLSFNVPEAPLEADPVARAEFALRHGCPPVAFHQGGPPIRPRR